MRRTLALAAIAAGLAGTVSATFAYTASNAVSASLLGQTTQAITPDDLKPAACSGLALTGVVTGAGSFQGTPASELVLGSAGADTIDGLGGDDCVVGGAGDDTLAGDAGTDVCLGGAGANTFATCETEG
jgi:Ca2+-binding RTX toxin-like protein